MSLIPCIRDLNKSFFSENDLFSNEKPYITTNESNTENSLTFLAENSTGDNSNRLHIGFSGWYNFDIIKATDAEYGILADVSKMTAALFKATKKTIQDSSDRFEFTEKMVEIFEREGFYRPLQHAEENQSDKLRKELNNPFSWLGEDRAFEKIKKMYSEERIIFAELDIRNFEVCEKLSQWIHSNHLNVHTLYVSNIGDALMDFCRSDAGKPNSHLSKMEQSVKHILQGCEGAWVIDATRIDHDYDDHFDSVQTLIMSNVYSTFLLRQGVIEKARDKVEKMLLSDSP